MDSLQMSQGRLSQRWAAIHGGILLLAFLIVVLGFPLLPWPWYFLLPLVFYGTLITVIPFLRRTAPQLAFGQVKGMPLLVTAGLTVVTCVALVVYQSLARPDVTELAGRLPISFFGDLVLAGLCFSLVNALLEEVIFRGILLEAVAAEWGMPLGIMVTAIFFGLGHRQGFPPGSLGAILAGIFGFALGLLRWWSGGLALAVGCHICADATIFGILVSGVEK